MRIKHYIEEIVSKGKQEGMEKLSDMLSEIIYQMKEPHYDKYKCYKMKLYEMAEGKVINEEMADEWVNSMKQIGEHWSLEETTNAMKSLGYKDKEVDFYVTANMMYNDNYELVKDKDELALKLAHNWLNDVDIEDLDSKLYNYKKYIVKERD